MPQPSSGAGDYHCRGTPLSHLSLQVAMRWRVWEAQCAGAMSCQGAGATPAGTVTESMPLTPGAEVKARLFRHVRAERLPRRRCFGGAATVNVVAGHVGDVGDHHMV